MNRMAIQALEKMETRKFKAKGKGPSESSCGVSDSLSSSSTSDCAICLEKYIDGEVRKVHYDLDSAPFFFLHDRALTSLCWSVPELMPWCPVCSSVAPEGPNITGIQRWLSAWSFELRDFYRFFNSFDDILGLNYGLMRFMSNCVLFLLAGYATTNVFTKVLRDVL